MDEKKEETYPFPKSADFCSRGNVDTCGCAVSMFYVQLEINHEILACAEFSGLEF